MARKKADDTEAATEETAVSDNQFPDLREGQTFPYAGTTYVVTKAGLPNSCMLSGKPVEGDLWIAESIDHARAGQGISPSFFLEQVQAATEKTADKA